MLELNKWVILDTFTLLVQFVFIFRYFLKEKRKIGFLSSLIFSYSAWLLVTPVGLFPVGILPLNNENSVYRNIFWHVKIGGLSINDAISILLLLTVVIALVLKRIRIDFKFLKQIYLLILIFIIGIISSLNDPFGVDKAQFLLVFRYFILLFLGIIGGLAIKDNFNFKWLNRYLKLLFLLSIFSVISMTLLSSSYRPPRYWGHAILQSQESQLPFLMLLFFSLFGVVKGKVRLFYLIVGMVPAIAGYKFSIILTILSITFCLLRFLISRNNIVLRSRFIIMTLLVSFLILPGVLVTYYAVNITDLGAIGTRYFQLKNMTLTMKNQGLLSELFGLGWNQWYRVYFQFPFIDFGAWTQNQLLRSDAKYSIQIIPFSLLRSIGLIGISIWIMILYDFLIRAYRNLKLETSKHPFLNILILSMLIQSWFSFPDILPETIIIESIILVGLSTYKNINGSMKVNRDLNAGVLK